MTEPYEPKILQWWKGLAPEEREKWWSEGDYCTYTVNGGKKVIELVVDDMRTELNNSKTISLYTVKARNEIRPAPCPQFWWKLAWQYLGVKRFLSALYDAGLIKTRSHEYDRGWGTVTSFEDDDEERIKGIAIRAAIACQERGEG